MMAKIAKSCGVQSASYNDMITGSRDRNDLRKHILPHKPIQTFATTATVLIACFNDGVRKKTTAAQRAALCEMTQRRWMYATECNGNGLFWFDIENDSVLRSLECLGTEEILENTASMLQLHFAGADDKLVDIIVDIGRTPHGYMGDGQRIELRTTTPHELLNDSGPQTATVTASDLTGILDRLGGEERIGGDNRAGVDRQLHRISVMRNKSDQIYGLTIRVGRTLRLRENVIRDIARCDSESGENVCIIDTSNEIGGDGLVPHECIGWARRIMVKSLNDRARVVIECVQIHTVETLILDEIGRKAEANAAGTVRLRGPRMIASARGDFRSLIKNQDLKGLVGGV